MNWIKSNSAPLVAYLNSHKALWVKEAWTILMIFHPGGYDGFFTSESITLLSIYWFTITQALASWHFARGGVNNKKLPSTNHCFLEEQVKIGKILSNPPIRRTGNTKFQLTWVKFVLTTHSTVVLKCLYGFNSLWDFSLAINNQHQRILI